MNSEQQPLLFEVRNAVAQITFCRPAALNALNEQMALAFRDAVARVAADESLRVLVVRGAGRGFMAGGDVAAMVEDPLNNAPLLLDPLHEAMLQMTQLPIPVLAALHGPVAGAGMSVALAADLALAADTTVFQMAYTRIGASPDGSGTWHLARTVGLRKAMEITLLSDAVDAQQALGLGLVNWVVPAEEFDERVEAMTKRLAEGATHAFGRSKALLRTASLRSLAEQLDAERAAFMQGAGGPEFREGAQAFLEKRKPSFQSTATQP
ncbi:MAG TPA: enoyl-CoA hydratase-related protein [Burkholderiaceae bacterium]|nr:enoyl-CoA hydratase-related protein [Burkholderiaceae bacterium]